MIKQMAFICALTFSVVSLAMVDGHEYLFNDGSDTENTSQAQLFQQLAEELRCPKCQNQNLADSNSMIAGDLRRELYQQVKAGGDEQSIIDFMVNRYGEFVLYKPQVNTMTYVLWFGPLGLLFIAGVCLVMIIRKRKQGSDTHIEISAEQQKRLDELLAQNKGDDHV